MKTKRKSLPCFQLVSTGSWVPEAGRWWESSESREATHSASPRRALAGAQAPQRHLTPPSPKHPSLSPSSQPLIFPLFQKTWMLRATSWLRSPTAWAGGHPVPAPGAGRRSCTLSSFALLYGWFVGISLPAGGIIGNNIEWALSLLREYRSRVLMAFH